MTTTTASTTTPVYITFIKALKDECVRQGLPAPDSAPTLSGLPENMGYCFLQWSNGTAEPARLIIPKSITRMGSLHSHVDLSAYEGHIALRKPNGKVVCHFAPSLELVKATLSLFVGASRRASQAPVKRPPVASPATPSEPVKATLNDLNMGSSDEDEALLAALAD